MKHDPYAHRKVNRRRRTLDGELVTWGFTESRTVSEPPFSDLVTVCKQCGCVLLLTDRDGGLALEVHWARHHPIKAHIVGPLTRWAASRRRR